LITSYTGKSIAGCIFSEHDRYRNDKKILNLLTSSGVSDKEPDQGKNG
jgi:hypothetical protein